MQPTTERTGRYHLQELIAAGGMGEVWRAVDEALGRPVAVKLLRPEYSHDEVTLLRFRAEARHAGGLNHPGIAQVYDYEDATRDRPAYLVMELVSGPSLAGVLAGGRLDARRTADVLAQAAEALHAAHTAGVLHRDIKPGNLLIGPDGQVKVTDFGIAQSSRTGNLTRTGSLVGTMGYLAPERVAGRPATVASDLYALGIVGYECLTGHPPFQGEPLQVALAHRDQDLPGLPPWCLSQPGGAGLAALIARLTAKDPAGGLATAALVAEEARRIRDGFTGPGDFPAPTRPDQVPPPVAVPQRRHRARRQPRPYRQAWRTAGRGSTASAATPARPRRRRLAAAGLAAGILAVGLLGWLLATAGSHPSPGSPAQGHPAQAGRPASSAAAGRPARSAVSVRTVGVSTSLLGRPVSVVRRELRGLGLVVRVQPQPDQQAAPGSVVRISPTGQVPVGSAVLLTAATRPAPSAPASSFRRPLPPRPLPRRPVPRPHRPARPRRAPRTAPPAAPSTAKDLRPGTADRPGPRLVTGNTPARRGTGRELRDDEAVARQKADPGTPCRALPGSALPRSGSGQQAWCRGTFDPDAKPGAAAGSTPTENRRNTGDRALRSRVLVCPAGGRHHDHHPARPRRRLTRPSSTCTRPCRRTTSTCASSA